MHYRLEIVMPPTEDVKAAIEQIMAPFDENGEERSHAFWDYWLVGGRWSGKKMLAKLGGDRMEKFHAILDEARFTVSALRAGKPTLKPESQIAKVDALWCEHFPDSPIKQCPLFDHYKGDIGDVMRLDEIPKDLTAGHVIIAGPDHTGEGLEAVYRIQDEIWNGVIHVKSEWDGKVSTAIETHLKRIESYRTKYIEKNTPKPDWLVVTVDYHS